MTAVQSLEKSGGPAANQWKPYPAYKPSGVEWLGDVPEGWAVKRLKYSASINDETLPETTDPDFELEYVDIGGVSAVEGITATEQMVFENAPSRARRRARHGDSIVSTVRTYLRAIAPIRNPPDNLVVSTGFAVVRPRKVEEAYLSYALRESSFVESVVARSTGVSYPACNASEVGCIPIPLPDPAEQRAIAEFLDRETGKIDLLVAKKRELIEKLKEERAALICRAVTRGLNPDAQLKPSGVEWLGDVPEHWDALPMKRRFHVVNGGTPSSSEESYWEDGAIAWFTPEDLGRNHTKVITSSRRQITREGLLNCGASLTPRHSVLVSTRAPIGHVAISDVESCCNQGCRYFVKARDGLNPDFFYYAIVASKAVLQAAGKGTTFLELSGGMLGMHQTPMPPPAEQRAIADFLDRETGKIDRLAAKVEEAIGRLQEYRAALITAAVTGKIDVRSEASGAALEYPAAQSTWLKAAEKGAPYGAKNAGKKNTDGHGHRRTGQQQVRVRVRPCSHGKTT